MQWYAAWWLNSESPLSAASRPPLPKGVTLYIVESNERRQQDSGSSSRNLLSNAERIEATPTALAAGAANAAEADGSSSSSSSSSATFHVYSSAATVELLVNGKSIGEKSNAEWMGWTEWNTTWEAGNVTAVAKDVPGGKAVATHSRVTSTGAAVAILLQLDAPSKTTATGQKLVRRHCHR